MKPIARREFLKGSVLAGGVWALGGCASLPEVGSTYPGWQPGELDIHFIHTGVGEQTFSVFPDGTTMLLDCGFEKTRNPGYAELVPARPSSRLRGGEWVARYLARVSPTREIDWVVVSHWHDDHVLGLYDVARRFTFRRWLDHQYPRFGLYNLDASAASLTFARDFIPAAVARGMKAEPFDVGAANQIGMVHGGAGDASFEIRNLAANGVVWDGRDGRENCLAAHLQVTGKKTVPENQLSNALRLRYGAFTYYTGGDIELELTGADGRAFDWEAKVGHACGPVDVCKTNHHAFWHAMHAGFVREIRAQAYLSNVWSPNQVNEKNLSIIASRALYPGPRRIYHGYMPHGKATSFARKPFLADISPAQGHQVVKVAPGGETFRIYTLTTADESMRILAAADYVSGERG